MIFVDDLNMPRLDRYGSQPPIELLRQYQDFGGFYDRNKLFWKDIQVTLGFKLYRLFQCIWQGNMVYSFARLPWQTTTDRMTQTIEICFLTILEAGSPRSGCL